jgi:hypothetical protein
MPKGSRCAGLREASVLLQIAKHSLCLQPLYNSPQLKGPGSAFSYVPRSLTLCWRYSCSSWAQYLNKVLISDLRCPVTTARKWQTSFIYLSVIHSLSSCTMRIFHKDPFYLLHEPSPGEMNALVGNWTWFPIQEATILVLHYWCSNYSQQVFEAVIGWIMSPWKRYTGPLSLVPQNVALVEDKVFTHVIKLRWGPKGGP